MILIVICLIQLFINKFLYIFFFYSLLTLHLLGFTELNFFSKNFIFNKNLILDDEIMNFFEQESNKYVTNILIKICIKF